MQIHCQFKSECLRKQPQIKSNGSAQTYPNTYVITKWFPPHLKIRISSKPCLQRPHHKNCLQSSAGTQHGRCQRKIHLTAHCKFLCHIPAKSQSWHVRIMFRFPVSLPVTAQCDHKIVPMLPAKPNAAGKTPCQFTVFRKNIRIRQQLCLHRKHTGFRQ